MLEARSIAEARLYIEHEPCPTCAHRGFGHPAKLVEHGDRLAAKASGYCPSCGEHRAFELLLADERVPPMAWGNQTPSTLIDAGEWLAIADDFGARVPAEIAGLDRGARERAREDLAKAIAAVEEVLKFLPAGSSEPPRTAFFTARGLETYMADRKRFARDRLEILAETWRELAVSFIEN